MEEVNFKVVQGDSFEIAVSYKNEDGTAINLVDYTARMDVRDIAGGKILCASATEDNGGIVINDSAGQISIKFTPSQTKKFTLPNAAHQLQIINNATNKKITLISGHIKVSPSVIK